MGLEKLLLVPAMILSMQSTVGITNKDIVNDYQLQTHKGALIDSGKILCEGPIYGPFLNSPYDWKTNETIDEFYSGKSSLIDTIKALSTNEDYLDLRGFILTLDMSTEASRLLVDNYSGTEYERKLLNIGILGEAYNSCRYLFSLPQKITCEKKEGIPLTPEFEKTFDELKRALSYGPVLEMSKKIMYLFSNAETYNNLEAKAFSEEFISFDNLGKYSNYVIDGVIALQAINILDFLKDREKVETAITERIFGVMYQYKVLSIMNYMKYKDVYDLFKLPETVPEKDNDFSRYTA